MDFKWGVKDWWTKRVLNRQNKMMWDAVLNISV